MPVFVLNTGAGERATAIEAKIVSAMPGSIRIAAIGDVPQQRSKRAQERDYLVLVSIAPDAAYLSELVETASRQRDRLFLVLVSDDINASDYKRLVRTGAAEWVSAATAVEEIIDIIAGRHAATEARNSTPTPVVASFVPSAGGVGNTMLAVEVASDLKSRRTTSSRKICIVDLDFQTSHLCDYLDIEPRLRIDEISANPDRLDDQLFDIFVSRHSSGLHAFAAPRSRFDTCNLNVAALDALFDLIAIRYDLIIIDFPSHWFSWTPQIVSDSGRRCDHRCEYRARTATARRSHCRGAQYSRGECTVDYWAQPLRPRLLRRHCTPSSRRKGAGRREHLLRLQRAAGYAKCQHRRTDFAFAYGPESPPGNCRRRRFLRGAEVPYGRGEIRLSERLAALKM